MYIYCIRLQINKHVCLSIAHIREYRPLPPPPSLIYSSTTSSLYSSSDSSSSTSSSSLIMIIASLLTIDLAMWAETMSTLFCFMCSLNSCILQVKIMAHTGIIPQLAHHTWIMCQTNCQKFSILLLSSKKILFLFKK